MSGWKFFPLNQDIFMQGIKVRSETLGLCGHSKILNKRWCDAAELRSKMYYFPYSTLSLLFHSNFPSISYFELVAGIID